jgi:hypothetical protein
VSGKGAVSLAERRRLLLASPWLPSGVTASGPQCVGDKADFRRAAVSGPLLADCRAGTAPCKNARLPMFRVGREGADLCRRWLMVQSGSRSPNWILTARQILPLQPRSTYIR